jgi:hypothetical protein
MRIKTSMRRIEPANLLLKMQDAYHQANKGRWFLGFKQFYLKLKYTVKYKAAPAARDTLVYMSLYI